MSRRQFVAMLRARYSHKFLDVKFEDDEPQTKCAARVEMGFVSASQSNSQWCHYDVLARFDTSREFVACFCKSAPFYLQMCFLMLVLKGVCYSSALNYKTAFQIDLKNHR
jgi:hypothetical protein